MTIPSPVSCKKVIAVSCPSCVLFQGGRCGYQNTITGIQKINMSLDYYCVYQVIIKYKYSGLSSRKTSGAIIRAAVMQTLFDPMCARPGWHLLVFLVKAGAPALINFASLQGEFYALALLLHSLFESNCKGCCCAKEGCLVWDIWFSCHFNYSVNAWKASAREDDYRNWSHLFSGFPHMRNAPFA